ncbi:unnamed protein product [Effrenium voratum]|uniref:Uncharacterized protein n=1 Tax=Effrenium voratum TaxID=2562239 RepID=A0AA36JGQ8_9DINO|nr:unnamed protein product [Effrenium voratum]
MDNKSAEEPQWHPPGVAALPCRIRHRGRRCPRGWLGLPRVLQVPCRRVPVTPGSSCQVHAVPSNLEMHQEPAADAKGSWMAPVDPEKLRLAELNLTREGRAIQCFSEGACPGGQLPLDPVEPMCSEGRTGVLCAACTAGHYATKGECEKCQEASQDEKVHLWGTAAAVAAIGLGLAGVAWLSRGAVTEHWKQADVKWHVLKELAARQALVLLQVVQLYGVLAALAPDPSTGQGTSRESFWERIYVEALQLNLAQVLQDAFRIQCIWDGAKVRLAFALASPLAPLVMLLACGLLEIIKPSVGAGAAFKILTIFFIGGARESAALLRCQLVDKGRAPLGDFAFLQKLPFLLCSETEGAAKWVYAVGYGTVAVYVAVVPVALLYLYMRQYIVLKPSKTITAQAKKVKGSWITKLRPVRALEEPMEVNDEYLLAAAVAHMVVTFQGKVWLQLQGGKAVMKSPESEGRAAAELTVNSLLDSGDEVAEMLRSRAIMEMLVERSEMEQASKSDRASSLAPRRYSPNMPFAAPCGWRWCRSSWPSGWSP